MPYPDARPDPQRLQGPRAHPQHRAGPPAQWPDGEPGDRPHPGRATVVAVDAEGRVCLLRQYRHAAGGWLDELPAGKLDGGEPPIDCAQRELAEEAGVVARDWQKLGQFFSTPGVLTEVIHVYLARDLAPSDAQPEDHGVFEARWVPLEEAMAMATDGRLRDAKSIIGLCWAQARLRSP